MTPEQAQLLATMSQHIEEQAKTQQTMRARLAGIQQQQEQIERQQKAILDYLRTQQGPPTPKAERQEQSQLSKYEQLKIGRWFLAEHGWNKVAQRLVQDGLNVPHKADERVLAAARWALSRYQAVYLLEQAQHAAEG